MSVSQAIPLPEMPVTFKQQNVIPETLEDIEAFEMANLRQKSTGLPMVIWVSEKGHTQHGPRVKVCKTHSHKADLHNAVSVSITEPPEIMAGTGLEADDFALVARYIRLNKAALLDYWYGRIDTMELMGSLQVID